MSKKTLRLYRIGRPVLDRRFNGRESLSGIAALRLLGNPIGYQVAITLEAGDAATPSKLAKLTGRHVSAINIHPAKLWSADVVRYDTSGKTVRYWLKQKGEMRGLLKMLERVVNTPAKVV